jgi:Domain of unknown function (DUF4402)
MTFWVRPTAMLLAMIAISASSRAWAANAVIKVNAQATKPLSLTRVQDLDLGTIVLGPGTWSGATVSISRAGVFSCANPNTTCSGARQVATYNLSGSNNAAVRIAAPNVTLTNQNDPTKTLVMVIDSPGTVTIPNSGKKGVDFSLGGSIALSSSTAGGLYAGTFDVTVDY